MKQIPALSSRGQRGGDRRRPSTVDNARAETNPRGSMIAERSSSERIRRRVTPTISSWGHGTADHGASAAHDTKESMLNEASNIMTSRPIREGRDARRHRLPTAVHRPYVRRQRPDLDGSRSGSRGVRKTRRKGSICRIERCMVRRGGDRQSVRDSNPESQIPARDAAT